jgi:hypothetical protein
MSTRTPRTRTVLAGLAVSALVATSGVIGVGAVDSASGAVRHWSSCAAMQRVHPHGVGKVGAHDKTSSTPVRNFYKNTALYLGNNGPRAGAEYDLDRDNDGIACEKR